MVGEVGQYDGRDGQDMFFVVQRDSVRHLTLSFVTDGGFHDQFENSMRRKSLTVLQLLHYIEWRGDDAGWQWSSLCVTLVYTLDVVNGPNPVYCIFEKTLPGEFS